MFSKIFLLCVLATVYGQNVTEESVTEMTTLMLEMENMTTLAPKSNPFMSHGGGGGGVTIRRHFKSIVTEDSLSNNNSTTEAGVESKKLPTYKAPPVLKKVHDYLIVVLLVAVMFAMGCSITWAQVCSKLFMNNSIFIATLIAYTNRLSNYRSIVLVVLFSKNKRKLCN